MSGRTMSGNARRPGGGLSDEDRVLWNIVARTAVPLEPARRRARQTAPFADETPADRTPPADAMSKAMSKAGPLPIPAPNQSGEPPARPAMPPYFPPVSAPRRPAGLGLDAPTAQKLARGRLPLEARVDLHGMFQEEAHALLLSFLRRAHTAGARHVLVITGKGSSSGGDGVLRRSVPGWLATPPFRDFVSGFDAAARGHGGTGALYVRLKRRG